MGTRAHHRIAAVLLGSLLVAGACSDTAGDVDDATSTTTTTTSALPDESPDPPPEETAEPPAEPVARWEDGDSGYLFDPTVVHTFELTLAPEDLAFLDADPTAEEWVEGELTFEGETVAPVGIRYKGSIGAFLGCVGSGGFIPSGEKTCTKLSMKIKVNWEDSNREFYGVRRIQLHSQNLDASLMHERLGYHLFREMGVAAPRSTHARLIVNGELVGLFALTEQIDGRMTRDNFADGTGNLYKEVWPIYFGEEVVSDDALWSGLKTNEDDDPSFELVQRFAGDLLDASTDAERRAVIETYMDVEATMAQIAVDRAIRHDDGPLHWYCGIPTGSVNGFCGPHNFYIYEDPTAARIHLIPWDLDNAFDNLVNEAGSLTSIADPWGTVSNDCQPFSHGRFGIQQLSAACDPLFAALALFDDEYEAAVERLHAGPLAEAESLLAEWSALIEPFVAEAAAAHDDAPSVEGWRTALDRLAEALRTNVQDR